MTKKVIYLLIDYREMFYSSTKEVAGSMDTAKLKSLFEEFGYDVFVERFTDVDFSSDKYSGAFMLYQSSEDPDLRYKDYIEDVLLGLIQVGAILLPRFELFRAHHNKVFMEILREVSNIDASASVRSKAYGTFEELDLDIQFPVVVKPAAGSRSQGVQLASNSRELAKAVSLVSKTFSMTNIRRRIRSFILGTGYKAISQHRGKFIVQNYIGGLVGDYKVLVYADRYYILERKNRANDFRASGSGLLAFPSEVPSALLSYAEEVFSRCNSPFASLDIASKAGKFFLLEFQFVSFGQYALERSDHYYRKADGEWVLEAAYSDLESTFVYAVDAYLRQE